MQPNNDKLTEVPVPSLLDRSIDAFYRNLPELLKKYYGKWVVYHGDEFVCAGRSETELYEKCYRRGLKDGEFYALFVTDQALYDQEEIPLPPDR